MEEKMRKMSYEEFREYCKSHSDGLVDQWDTSLFKVVCVKCSSDKTGLVFKEKEVRSGSEYTGMWTSQDEGFLVKCMSCGNAMVIGDVQSLDQFKWLHEISS